MTRSVKRVADLSSHPNLVVIYMGMRVYSLPGVWTVLSLRQQVRRAVAAKPDGLLFHQSFYFSLLPLHVGLRQYWRDFDALEAWTRTFPHQRWWKDFVRNPRGTGFWHETYTCGGGIEGVYDAMREPTGLRCVAPGVRAEGCLFSARERLNQSVRDGAIGSL